MKRRRNIFRTAIVVLAALSLLLPGSVLAATKAKPKPVISYTHTPGNSNDYFISKNGVLVSESIIRFNDGTQQTNITTATSKGKVSKFSGKNSFINYGTGTKGKEVFYVYNSEKKIVKALNMSLKKIWEVKLTKDPSHLVYSDNYDNGFPISKTDKLTIDGKKAKIKNVDPTIKRIGKYEYRINEKEQTIQKTDKEIGKVLWKKRAFDMKGKDGNTISAVSVQHAFFDEKGNAFATVGYPGTTGQVVGVSNNGELLWYKSGYNFPNEVVGDVIYYYEYATSNREDYPIEYNINVANKNTGKIIKTYTDINNYVPPILTTRANNLYVVNEDFLDIYNSKGKRIVSYKSPNGGYILNDQFDNKNNLHILSGYYSNPPKKENGWVFTYSPAGKLISKKTFDQKNYYQVLIDPSGKQNYMIKKVPGKANKYTLEFYKYN